MTRIAGTSTPPLRVVIALAAGLLLALVAQAFVLTSPAAAQQPAICEEYEGLPQCLPNEPPDDDDDGDGGDDDGDQSSDPGDDGADDGDAGAGIPGAGGAPPSGVSGADAGGSLPFTGYPLTPLVWILLALLLAGLALRAYLALRDRLRARSAAAA